MKFCLALHCVATVLMTGVIWFVQVVHYPLMNSVGSDHFPVYSELHRQLTRNVVAGPMAIEGITALILLTAYGKQIGRSKLFLASLILLGIQSTSTFLWQVPLHMQLAEEYSPQSVNELIASNWIRTIAWTGRTGLLVWLVVDRFPVTEKS